MTHTRNKRTRIAGQDEQPPWLNPDITAAALLSYVREGRVEAQDNPAWSLLALEEPALPPTLQLVEEMLQDFPIQIATNEWDDVENIEEWVDDYHENGMKAFEGIGEDAEWFHEKWCSEVGEEPAPNVWKGIKNRAQHIFADILLENAAYLIHPKKDEDVGQMFAIPRAHPQRTKYPARGSIRKSTIGALDVCREEATNPNTDPKRLYSLAYQGYKEVFENPVLPLISLEDPVLYRKIVALCLGAMYLRGIVTWAQASEWYQQSQIQPCPRECLWGWRVLNGFNSAPYSFLMEPCGKTWNVWLSYESNGVPSRANVACNIGTISVDNGFMLHSQVGAKNKKNQTRAPLKKKNARVGGIEEDQQEALNPNTLPTRLLQLARTGVTGPEGMGALVLENPVLPLIAMEDIRLYHEIMAHCYYSKYLEDYLWYPGPGPTGADRLSTLLGKLTISWPNTISSPPPEAIKVRDVRSVIPQRALSQLWLIPLHNQSWTIWGALAYSQSKKGLPLGTMDVNGHITLFSPEQVGLTYKSRGTIRL